MRQSVPSWQWGSIVGTIAIFLVLGTALTIESAIVGGEELGRTAAYDNAKTCATSAAISDCRFHGPARIVRTYTDKDYRGVEVAFDQLGGLHVSADINPNEPSEWQRWQPEDQVNAELWSGLLTVVEGARTESNPDYYQGTGITITAWIAGPITLLLAAAFMWTWVMWRRQRRRLAARLATEDATHPVTTQQLTLTSEMSDFLRKEAELAAHPASMALVVLGLASVIPLFFTVLFAVKGILLNLYIPFTWLFFLGFGAIVSFGLLHDLRQERRDLVGGVFNRAAGSFSTQVTAGKFGTRVQVVVGGRKLSSEIAPALESIESFAGGVDYLPISGDTLEVRDESGRVLWSRFAKTAPAPLAQSAAR